MSVADAASAAGWYRWAQVTAHIHADCVLYRASSPNYIARDFTQLLDQLAVGFLVRMGVRGIISFNELPYAPESQQLLEKEGIAYLYFSTVDRTPPSRESLKAAYEFVLGKKCVLVHCGYGHGRTGTGVTAIQMYHTGGQYPVEADWRTVNHVEMDTQIRVLRELAQELKEST